MTNALQAVLDRAVQEHPSKKVAREPHTRSPAKTAASPRRRTQSREQPEADTEQGTPSPKHYRPVRDGKRFVGAHFHPEVARQLKVLAAEDGTTIQELLEQAVDLLFVKNGKAKIAELVKTSSS
jgi:hypothetical protein